MNTNIQPTVAADDARTVLKFSREDISYLVAPRVLAVMRSGGFYVRQRRGLQPSLWRRAQHKALAPVNFYRYG